MNTALLFTGSLKCSCGSATCTDTSTGQDNKTQDNSVSYPDIEGTFKTYSHSNPRNDTDLSDCGTII